MKKIIVVIVVLVILIFGVWSLFFRNTGREMGGGNLDGDTGDFPEALPPPSTPTPVETPVDNGQPENSSLSSPLSKISAQAISGASLVGQTPTTTVVYVERATGHVYQLVNTSTQPIRLSNTTVPKIYASLHAQIGEKIYLLLRYLKDDQIQNFLASITKTETEGGFLSTETSANSESELLGEFLSNNIYSLAISPTQKSLFYLEQNSGRTSGAVLDLTGKNQPASIFTSQYNGWLASWPAPDVIALQTKSTASADSYLYFLNPKTKKVEKILGPVLGLTTRVSPSGKNVIYSGNTASGLVFGVYDVANKITVRLPVKTLADKCVWSAEEIFIYCGVPATLSTADYPDSWYRGETNFADNIWKINVKTKRSDILFNPQLANVGNIDVSELFLSGDEKDLYFTNKTDANLWLLSLAAGF